MHARTLPASRGWAWIIEGFALWKRNPALITFLVFGYWLCLLVLAAVPFIGQILMSLAMPALSLGIYNGCKAVAEKRKAGPEILISGFKQNLPEQIKIGGIYLAGTFVVLGVLIYVLIWVAMVPAGLGVLVLVPVLAGTVYSSYQDVFGEVPALPAPADTPPQEGTE